MAGRGSGDRGKSKPWGGGRRAKTSTEELEVEVEATGKKQRPGIGRAGGRGACVKSSPFSMLGASAVSVGSPSDAGGNLSGISELRLSQLDDTPQVHKGARSRVAPAGAAWEEQADHSGCGGDGSDGEAAEPGSALRTRDAATSPWKPGEERPPPAAQGSPAPVGERDIPQPVPCLSVAPENAPEEEGRVTGPGGSSSSTTSPDEPAPITSQEGVLFAAVNVAEAGGNSNGSHGKLVDSVEPHQQQDDSLLEKLPSRLGLVSLHLSVALSSLLPPHSPQILFHGKTSRRTHAVSSYP